MLDLLTNIRIVLVEPTHPGNIGAVARSMKTMGLSRLFLASPKKFPDSEASQRAAGAESVLESAQVVGSAQEAIADCTLVFGTSVRDREVAWPTFNPRVSADKMLEHIVTSIASTDVVSDGEVAILFGRESSGLTNQEMDLCHSQIRISANDEYSSLNLASAVQIVAYELRMKVLSMGDEGSSLIKQDESQKFASKSDQQGHIEHLQQTLELLEFVKVKPPTVLMRKLTRLYNKSQLTVEEIHILRGILSAINNKLN